jgi:hypothetical protein
MKKPMFGVLCGAIAYFVWGMLSWTVIPWHNHVVKTLPEEQLISDTLKTVVTEPGVYIFPSLTSDRATFAERFGKGPTGTLAFSLGGRTFMGPKKFLTAIASAFVVAAVTMMLLCAARERVKAIFPRALMVAAVGVAVFFSAQLTLWNWFSFPFDFTMVSAADSLAAFFILGLVQAPFAPRAER